MWLINTSTHRLVFHANEPTDKYLILSHTWEEEEVTFQDFQDLDFARTKKGFSKIEETCRLAREISLGWAWIDTCCIDKTSSAELSEAINSMFRWYHNSAICAAYLSDLPPHDGHAPSRGQMTRGAPGEDLEEPLKENFFSSVDESGLEFGGEWDGSSEGDPDSGGDPDNELLSEFEKELLKEHKSSDKTSWAKVEFPKCRWFTRGWTLQELLAPNNVKFYDKQWNFLGNKISLRDLLSEITNIDSLALTKSRPLRDYSVAARMSWSSERVTTRPEDQAYCLLGIFGVYMPLIYGEGTHAFARLQEEICRTTNDLSLFAWTSQQIALHDHHGLFAQSPADFWDCHRIERFSLSRRRDSDLTVTNNGLIFNKALIYSEGRSRIVLMLDCFSSEPGMTQNPMPIGIFIRQIGGQFCRKSAWELCKGLCYSSSSRMLSVLSLNARKFRFTRPAVPQSALGWETKIQLTRPDINVKLLSCLPLPYRTSPRVISWSIDDPAYLVYCILRFDNLSPSGQDGERFLFLVAWSLDAKDGTNKAFVWTEQCEFWHKICKILESREEAFPWPKNYVLRELLLDGKKEERLEASYRGKQEILTINVTKSSTGRDLEIMIER
ncbi:heterokaryon incompatibility protein-domain-containing protein [Ustulina deusta]|nr:heterokaryon incompatibility protein-domain-containing protein [Ustulina deusta]